MKLVIVNLAITLAAFGFGACTATESQRPTNNSNGNSSTVNTAINTAGNAANTVANTVSNAATAITTESAEDFLAAAAQGGQAEVDLGKLAATKAQNPEVRKYGQMMVTDHSKANTELKALAAKKTITVPAGIGSHQSTLDELKSLSGPEFDKAYVDAMVEDHEADVAEFQDQADNAADPDVKAFAVKTLPVLKKHLDDIKAIQAKMP